MSKYRNTASGDVVDVPPELDAMYDARADFAPVVSEQADAELDAAEDPADLKGKALDDALDAAGLPKSGKADEKRERLTEHLSGPVDADPPPSDATEPVTPDEPAVTDHNEEDVDHG